MIGGNVGFGFRFGFKFIFFSCVVLRLSCWIFLYCRIFEIKVEWSFWGIFGEYLLVFIYGVWYSRYFGISVFRLVLWFYSVCVVVCVDCLGWELVVCFVEREGFFALRLFVYVGVGREVCFFRVYRLWRIFDFKVLLLLFGLFEVGDGFCFFFVSGSLF